MARHPLVRARLLELLASIALVVLSAGVAVADETSGFVYTLVDVEGGANKTYGFHLNTDTGVTTLLQGFPMASGGTGDGRFLSERIAYDGHARLYVINAGNTTLSVFAVNR